MLLPILIAVVVGALAYWAYTLIFPDTTGTRTRNALQRIMDDTELAEEQEAVDATLRGSIADSAILSAIAALPGGHRFATLILTAGYGKSAGIVLIGFFVLLVLLLVVLNSVEVLAGVPAIILSVLGALLGVYRFLLSKVQKRIDQFIDMFPDVLDMIVRSVRSGFPLNTAIKLVAENMDPPVSNEFQQVNDEISLGRPLSQALARLAERIPEQDIRFFVVVLNVQQETGGNLAEVISNLSAIIRKRKQLRLKIKALTSEARATGMILGALPVVLTLALQIMAPHHLEPLYTTPEGWMVVATALGLMFTAFVVIRQMIQVDI